MTLGWINESQTLSLGTPVTSRLLKVNSIETGPGGPLVLRMELTNGEYLIEVRQQIGYDLNSLPEYGATVLYVPPGNAPIVVMKVMRPDDLDRAVFIDANADLAVVALNQTQTSFWFLVGEAQDGRDALATLHAISEASHSIDMAISENRILNLDLAKRLLDNARTLMGLARFQQATALALSAETTANAATVPSDYYDALQLINRAEQLKNKTSTITFTQSSQGWTLAVLGASQLAVAKAAFQAKNFTVAGESAQESIDSFNRADQIQLNETIMSWLSNLIIVIAAVIMAYALRYQLKNA